MSKPLQVPRRQRAERVARDLNYVVIESLRSVLEHGGVDAFDKAAGHVITTVTAIVARERGYQRALAVLEAATHRRDIIIN
jgi:ribulose kinase